MLSLSILTPGSTVRFRDDKQVVATILNARIFIDQFIEYEVVWWSAGKTRNTAIVSSIELESVNENENITTICVGFNPYG